MDWERQSLIYNHIADTHILANKASAKWQAIDHEDLVSVGYEGLCKAAISFQFDRGVRFWSYAERVINWDMFDWVRFETGRHTLFNIRRFQHESLNQLQETNDALL